MAKINYRQVIENNVIDCDVSYRGGNLKVNVSEIFPSITDSSEAIMGAYQNYLGGGIAGRICIGAMFDPATLSKRDQARFHRMSEELKKYFFDLNNGGGDEYMQENYASLEHNQGLPVSGY